MLVQRLDRQDCRPRDHDSSENLSRSWSPLQCDVDIIGFYPPNAATRRDNTGCDTSKRKNILIRVRSVSIPNDAKSPWFGNVTDCHCKAKLLSPCN